MSYYRQILLSIATFGLAVSVCGAAINSSVSGLKQSSPAQSGELINAKININSVTLKELAKVKGLGKAKSKNIIAYRKKHGSFKSLDEIKFVTGFKKMKPEQLKQIQDQFSIVN